MRLRRQAGKRPKKYNIVQFLDFGRCHRQFVRNEAMVGNAGMTATPLLSLASGVLPEHQAETVALAASAAGFPAFGVRIEPSEWTELRARRLGFLAESEGLTILDAEVLWIQPGGPDASLFRLVELGIAMEARNLLVVSSDADEQATAETFARICEHAAPAGVPVSLEFGRFTKVPDIAAALRIIAAVSLPNARLLIDPLHLFRSGGTVADVAAVHRSLFSYAQFCDAPPGGPDPDDFQAIRAEALDGRVLPGDGVLPLDDLLGALPSDLPLSVELRSRQLRDSFPDPAARAAHLLERTQHWFARHRA